MVYPGLLLLELGVASCISKRYNRPVIKSFAHKGLEKFFLIGSKAGIQPAHANKLGRQLAILNVAIDAKDMDKPGWKLHRLLGRDAGRWSVWVNGNWRLTFKFFGEDVEIVDYQDYH